MKTEQQMNQLLARRAAEWIETLKSDDAGDRAQFVEWLRNSKLHIESYLAVELLDHRIQSLTPADRPDIEGFLAQASMNVVRLEPPQLQQKQQKPRLLPRRFWPIAAAIGVVAILGAALWSLQISAKSNEWVATAIGEQRQLTLPDGSIVRMNVDTALRIRFGPAQRDIDLRSGEATFEVAQNPSKPFVVHTPTADIRALGTEFNVYQRLNTVVSVLDGRVQVTARREGASAQPVRATERLATGEEAQVIDGSIHKRPNADVGKTVAWQKGRISVDTMLLEDIVSEFNRHGGSSRLVLRGVKQNSYRFGGVFKATDAESFADVIEQQADLQVERRPGEIVIRPR